MTEILDFVCMLLVCATICTMYYTYEVYPEIGMVVNSQCNNPTSNWNGKVLQIPIWKSGFDNRNATHNSYTDTTADRRLLTQELITDGSNTDASFQRMLAAGFSHENALKMINAERKHEPIIIWGSHHKTGTYVAQKAFAHTCKRMNWCCIFHVTRDSIHVIEDTIRNEGENIRVIGHTQWVWDPKEIGITNYRFIHLVRKPYKKILSGYRYHKDGAEAWCKAKLPYTKACDMSYKEVKEAILPYVAQYERPHRNLRLLSENAKSASVVPNSNSNRSINNTLTINKSKKKSGRKYPPLWLKRDVVQSYCQSVHLCEPCCRREHEVDFASNRASNAPVSDAWIDPNPKKQKMKKKDSNISTVTKDKDKQHREMLIAGSEVMTADTAINTNTRKYARHALSVYDFQCRNLGPMTNLSLMETLNMVPPALGLKVEASIDYYENLRMARIYNSTFKDPLRNIIKHIDIGLSSKEEKELANELNFFDVNNSPLYRYSMTNPFVNHVDTKSASDVIDYKAMLERDTEISDIYTHINQLMYSLYHPQHAPQSAALKRIANKFRELN